jgi:HD-GYP domain-containing protein (c-di-GMP phosphodiesterase class II)
MKDDGTFAPIRLTDFSPNQTIGFDVYVRLPMNNRYVKYVDENDVLSETKIRRLQFRHINQLFIHKDDLQKCYDHLSRSIIESLRTASEEEKKTVMRSAAANLFASVDTLSSGEGAVTWANNCMAVSQTIVSDLIKTDLKTVFDNLKDMLSGQKSLSDHSLAVSSLSTVFGMALGYHDPRTLSDLSFGGLVHDIGLARVKPELVEKYLNRQELSDEELSTFKNHPHEGIKILGGLKRSKTITDKVLRIVIEHHEDVAGNGFPQGLTGVKIFLLAKVVAIADRVAIDTFNDGEVDIPLVIHRISKEQEEKHIYDSRVLEQIMKAIR